MLYSLQQNTKFLFRNTPSETIQGLGEAGETLGDITEGTTDRFRDKFFDVIPTQQAKKSASPKLMRLRDTAASSYKDVDIEVTEKDTTMYAPVRLFAKGMTALAAPLVKGVFGARRRIHESVVEMPGNSNMGISTLSVTPGIREAGVHDGVSMNAALESWQKENPDKTVDVFSDSDSGISDNISIIWIKKDAKQTEFKHSNYHSPVIKTDRKNIWSLWRYVGLVGSALDFAVSRVFGKNKAIIQTPPVDSGDGKKRVSMQVTPGLTDSTLRHNGFVINQALASWIKKNPQATISGLKSSSRMTGAEGTTRTANNITVVYTEKNSSN